MLDHAALGVADRLDQKDPEGSEVKKPTETPPADSWVEELDKKPPTELLAT